MHKKISSLFLAAAMTMTAVVPAFAVEDEVHVTEAGGAGDSKVMFEVVDTGSPEDPTIFSAYVPAVLPVKMDLEGNITVPTNAVIRNGVAKAIQVENAEVTTTGDWQHVDKESAAAGNLDDHLLSLSMNNQDLIDASFPWKVGADDSLSLNMEAMIPQQTTVSADEQIATVSFTLDWADNKLNATNELDKNKMDAALKNLTGKLTFTTTAYTGEDGVDISKNGDGSVIAVVNGQDATVYSEGGVLAANPYGIHPESSMFYLYQASAMNLTGLDTKHMTDMRYMFSNCFNLIDLDLSSFDTKSVTTMNGMFSACHSLATVDLSSFNTSAVKNMSSMFHQCTSLTTLDLSNFVTSAVGNMSGMFWKCPNLVTLDLSSFDTSHTTADWMVRMFEDCGKLTTAYGRTQADCDNFNKSPYKSSNVNFIVKPA